MPTYDYKCDTCGYTFELFQSMKDEPIDVCPECGEHTARRLISSGAGLVFKGSGFYQTDYVKNDNGKHAAKTSRKPAGSDSRSSDSPSESPASGDSSPAAKTDSSPAPASGDTKSE